jgi:protein gp37
MAGKSNIEWTDATWNPIVGCSIVSPGCTNCYAMKQAARIVAMQPASHYAGTVRKVKGNAVWTGKLALAPDHILTAPLRWKKPCRIFVNSMGDLFHEDAPDEWIDQVFAVMALAPQHTFQVLTKRAKRMREYCSGKAEDRLLSIAHAFPPGTFPMTQHEIEAHLHPYVSPEHRRLYRAKDPLWPLTNVWLGVSCEDQARADERIPDLLDTHAAVRFVSYEPALGPIDFGSSLRPTCDRCPPWETPCRINCEHVAKIDWIICGGESGSGHRPMQIEWAEAIRQQCQSSGTAFFFKQDSGAQSGLRGRASDELWDTKQFPQVRR